MCMIVDFGRRKEVSRSLFLVVLMVASLQTPTLASTTTDTPDNHSAYESPPQIQIQSEDIDTATIHSPNFAMLPNHPAFNDITWSDPGLLYGRITDTSFLGEGYRFMVEETETEDHDNDGINDLDDLDDDNDGISDLIERFDGCFGTDPYDHDNDGVLDEFDFDDDNDGILEGPIDYSQGTDPWNVSADRYLDPQTTHPWTGLPVGLDTW